MKRSLSVFCLVLIISCFSFGCEKDEHKDKDKASKESSKPTVSQNETSKKMPTQAPTTKQTTTKVPTTVPTTVQTTVNQTTTRIQTTQPTTSGIAPPTRTINYTQNGEQKSITVTVVTGFENELLSSVNSERAKLGLEPLSLNSKLSEFALIRAAEAGVRWSHTRPDGTSCFTVLDTDPEFRNQLSEAGENLAWNQTTVTKVMQDWMNSPGHRANIVKESYNAVGLACVIVYRDNGSKDHLWAQMFATIK